MTYNLTENQKALARYLVKQVREGNLDESFSVLSSGRYKLRLHSSKGKLDPDGDWKTDDLGVLADAQMLRNNIEKQSSHGSTTITHTCTLKGLIYSAVDAGFVESSTSSIVATLDNPHPPEITISLKRLRERFPDEKKVGFLIMRFANDQPYRHIVDAVKQTAQEAGIEIIRADENQFHDNLWENVQTHMHGCSFGIAIYERIAFEQPNANVGLEVGYMMAMNKPVLLLKDRTVATLQTDLAGKLYKEFDPHNPAGTIPDQLERWLRDKGIVVGQ